MRKEILIRKRAKKKKIRKIVMMTILTIFLGMIFGASFYISTLLNKIDTKKITTNEADLGITEETKKLIEATDNGDDITNIALFGLDQQNLDEPGRSDSIMILTLDKAHKKIKLTSIMRDSYVQINGHGKDKINHAYFFGGPELAIRTINENFGLNIKGYVTVNFFSMEKIVDALGGITLDITKEEIPVMNYYITELANLENVKPNFMKNPGKQLLTGRQAVAYARNRYTGNGDFQRSERQRIVLSALMEKIQTAGVTKYPGLVSELLPYVQTSVSTLDMLNLGKDFLIAGIKNIEQERFPIDGYYKDAIIKDIWYLTFEEKETKDQFHKYIFEDIKPVPKK